MTDYNNNDIIGGIMNFDFRLLMVMLLSAIFIRFNFYNSSIYYQLIGVVIIGIIWDILDNTIFETIRQVLKERKERKRV